MSHLSTIFLASAYPSGDNTSSICSSLFCRRLLLLLLLLALQSDIHGAQGRLRYNAPYHSMYRSRTNACYLRGKASKCMPKFDNVVYNLPVEVTSTCGTPPSQVCRHREKNGKLKRYCHMCDAKNPLHSYPPSKLVDYHDFESPTCWISGPVTPSSPSVNITINLEKRFEVLYVYMKPCGSIPDALTLYKSSDFGKSWQPWRYYATNCHRAFGMSTWDPDHSETTTTHIQQAVCEQIKPLRAYIGKRTDRIVFSTTTGAMSDDNPALIDWRTTTNIRVVLSRFPEISSRSSGGGNKGSASGAPKSDESDVVHYSFSTLAVGGRCKCNGHAMECRHFDGKLRCMCKHNTDGDDCERCRPFYYDRPWARATDADANICRECQCNLHSNRCVFSQALFLISKRKGGGICQKCRDNTDGRACQYCKRGFYRDWTKPPSHKWACRPCSCHPLGSLNQMEYPCDRKTGACQCRPNIIGKFCNRCKEGYIQSNNPMRPCVLGKRKRRRRITPKWWALEGDVMVPCYGCTKNKRIRFKKFCRQDYAVHVTVIKRSVHGKNIRYLLTLRTAFRTTPDSSNYISRKNSQFAIWGEQNQLDCYCQEMVVGKSYLILSSLSLIKHQGRDELLLNKKSHVLNWQYSWRRRMNKYRRRERRGRCRKRWRQRQPLYYRRKKFKRREPLRRPIYARPNTLSSSSAYKNNFDNYGYYGINKKRV